MAPVHKISPKLPRSARDRARNDNLGLGKVYQLFGDELNTLIEQLNETLAA